VLGGLERLFALFRATESKDPAVQLRWRQTVAWAITTLFVLQIFILLAMFIGLPRLGQLAWNGHSAEVMHDTLRELRRQQSVTTAKLDRLEMELTQQQTQSTAADIRLLVMRRCRTQDPAERDLLNRAIFRQQAEYAAITHGEHYALPECDEL
jgi:hypothetical protein